MSQIDASFDALRQAILSLWSTKEHEGVILRDAPSMVLLILPNDIASFTVFDGSPEREFKQTYAEFKRLYRKHSRDWDAKTLSFVVCRSTEHEADDRFYSRLEYDPLFCRKYVIRACENLKEQRIELLRLPFLPLLLDDAAGVQRPEAAQDYLQSAGVSASLTRKLIESGYRAANRIALDLRDGRESLPEAVSQPREATLELAKPQAKTRMLSLTIEGFRAYKGRYQFDLNAPVVVFYGPNGLGKTSIFDAIDYASTGRIGRLCRQRRSQAEFSRIATHLDKTPGSGSVALTIQDHSSNAVDGRWKLQRSTGNWTTAWINDLRVDRKEVLSRLTKANWVEGSPRQQAFESLFRATHLFAQDEQELFGEFKKGSYIPEAFVSEMLALQDYSQGISKSSAVLAELVEFRSTAEHELGQLRSSQEELQNAIAAIGDSGLKEQSPIEVAITDLRREIDDSDLVIELPPEVSSAVAFEEWLAVLTARAEASHERIKLASVLSNELPDHQRALAKKDDCQSRSKESNEHIVAVELELQSTQVGIEANGAAVNQAEAILRTKEQRRRELRLALEELTELSDKEAKLSRLQIEMDSLVGRRSELEEQQRSDGAELSNLISETFEIDSQLRAFRSSIEELRGLLADYTQFESDLTTSAQLQIQISEVQSELDQHQHQKEQVTKNLNEARLSREAYLREYEQALADSTDLEELLGRIQVHVKDNACPLCGSEFESVEVLLERVRDARSRVLAEKEVLRKYQDLVSAEAKVLEQLRDASAKVSATQTTLSRLKDSQALVQDRLSDYRGRLDAADIAHSSIDTSREIMLSQLEKVEERLESTIKQAEELGRDKEMVEAHSEEGKTELSELHSRIASLKQQMEELSDRRAELNARLSQILPTDKQKNELIRAELEELEELIQESLKSIERLKSDGLRRHEEFESLNERKRSLAEERDKLLSSLEAVNESIISFQQRVRSVGIHGDIDETSFGDAISQEEGVVKLTRKFLNEGLVITDAIKARDARLRLLEHQGHLDEIKSQISDLETQLARIDAGSEMCTAVEKLLRRERQDAIERHITAYGPMVTMIQQRLRSVYGFGGIQLEVHGGGAKVHVEWRNRNLEVLPTDFFSDSERQILMLSIFLAGGLRQNWSGFAPVLLDDPVTHFDDLNAYAFVEMIRGTIATSPQDWQFIISTCEKRLYDLMRQKFSRLADGAAFYEFTGMSEDGPIVVKS